MSPLTVAEARAILIADEALDLSYEERLASNKTFGIEELNAWAMLVASAKDFNAGARERRSGLCPEDCVSRPNVTDAIVDGLDFARACVVDQRVAAHARGNRRWDARYDAALAAIDTIIRAQQSTKTPTKKVK